MMNYLKINLLQQHNVNEYQKPNWFNDMNIKIFRTIQTKISNFVKYAIWIVRFFSCFDRYGRGAWVGGGGRKKFFRSKYRSFAQKYRLFVQRAVNLRKNTDFSLNNTNFPLKKKKIHSKDCFSLKDTDFSQNNLMSRYLMYLW